MSSDTYINIRTGEYPRHIGDVQLAPDEPWEPVIQTPFPERVEGYRWVEDAPALIDGVWHRVWKQIVWVPPPEEPLDEEL